MLEILALIGLTKWIGSIVEQKGHKSGWYKVLTVVLWFGGEIIGAILGAIVTGADESAQCLVYIFALGGAAAGAGIAYLIANSLSVSPDRLVAPFGAPPGMPSAAPLEAPPVAPFGAPLQASKTNGLAITSLVLGIVSIPMIFCYGVGIPFAIAAFITGLIGRRQVKESDGAQSGEGMALAGVILGGVGMFLGLAVIVIVILVLLGPVIGDAFSNISQELMATPMP